MNQTFKNVLKALGQSALKEAGQLVPGATIFIDGMTKLFDHNNDNNREGLEQIEKGVIEAIKSLSPDKVDNAVLLAEGIAGLEASFAKVRAALKS